jgi:hypothetical protein
MPLHHIISPPSIRSVVFPPRDFQFLVYSQVYDIWVFVIRGDLIIEDSVYSAGRHNYRPLVFRRVLVTGDVFVTADWVEHHAGGQSRSEETGRYLSDEFNAGWVVDIRFLERANGKRVRKNAGEGWQRRVDRNADDVIKEDLETDRSPFEWRV